MIKKLTLGLILAISVLMTSLSAGFAQSNEDGARAAINDQLESFLSGDFDRAYSYASDNIKQIYPNVNTFMMMVKRGYLPVLSPGNYAFGKSETGPNGEIVQEVLIRAPDGADWTAVYLVKQIEDGSWKINGVNLRKGAAGMT